MKMNSYKVSALILIVHGGLMELLGALAMIPCLLLGTDKFGISKLFFFNLSYLQENLSFMIVMSSLYGIIRLVAAWGMLKNRFWGLVLAIIVSTITIILMCFMLPFGVMDGIFSTAVLLLVLTKYYGNKKIED